MKFLLEFVACCRSCSSEVQQQADEKRLLVVAQEPPRRMGRKQGRGRGGSREWRPSLSSISEDVLTVERINNVERHLSGWRRTLKRKVSSMSQRDGTRSLDHHDGRRRASVQVIIPALSATPFMF